jgi:transposase
VSHAICAPGGALFDLPDVHVLAIKRGPRWFTLVVETVAALVGCPSCAVLATGHGLREVRLHDLTCAGVPVRLWRKRIFQRQEDACEVAAFSEIHSLAAPRARLTPRAIAWAVAQLRSHDIAVSALAEMLGVAWNIVWDAVALVIEIQLAADERHDRGGRSWCRRARLALRGPARHWAGHFGIVDLSRVRTAGPKLSCLTW